MRLSRRSFLAGVCIAALFAGRAEAFPHGIASPIAKGWNTLPLGAGGLVTGMFIANDGSMVCRTDVGNIYRWSGKTSDYANPSARWLPLLNYASLGSSAVIRTSIGGWEHVLAPGNSAVHVAIFGDIAGSQTKGWVYYSANSGATWNQSNLSFLNSSVDSNSNPGAIYKNSYYKIVVDPANENVAYCGVPINSGNSAGAYTTLNQSGGSTLATWASVKISGATPVGAVTTGIACGLAFDPSQGTTTVGGQIVTKRIIIPVGGVGIFESTDGGVTFTEIAAGPMGTANFYVTNAAMNAAGVYYCAVVSASIGGVWRYASGTWTNIKPPAYAASEITPGFSLIVKPSDNTYLSATGVNGIGAGYTSLNADTGSPPTWNGRRGGQNPTLKAASYDIGYMNYIFGQGSGAFTFGPAVCVDPLSGACFWGGNQSVWYFAASAGSTVPIGPPDYNTAINTFSWSMGRGQEATVAQDVLCPPGGTYPVLAAQDLGTPMRGTFTIYPADMLVRFLEYTCENLEYAANDPSFIVARATGQAGSGALQDVSSYSPNYGADGTWTQIAGTPTSLWQASITATISNGVGGAGTILDVSACSGTIFPNGLIAQTALAGGTFYGRVQPYGTSGTTGTGGTGTYILDTTSTVLTPTALFSVTLIQGGQTVAVDKDHWVTVPAGLTVSPIPAYTTNATGAATWALCSGLPAVNWMGRPWTFGKTSKPLAVGYGADLGTVWACYFATSGGATLYRSTDSGASFSSIATWAASGTFGSGRAFCLSVPGYPNELWVTAAFSGGSPTGFWHITNANTAAATVTAVSLPVDADLIETFTLGAPATPGGYPALYIVGNQSGMGGVAPRYLYRGTWNGSTLTWARFGPTGTQQDLPVSCQICGFQSIRGDWNVYGRLYVSSQQSGYAYYNP